MNRRGNVPVILAVPVFLVLIIILLFTFLNFNEDFDRERRQIDELNRGFEFSNAYVEGVFEGSVAQAIRAADNDDFERSFNETFKEIVGKRDLRLEYGGNFFGKIRNGEYSLKKSGSLYILKVEEIFVTSKVQANEMKRNLVLEARFNEQGLA